MNILVIGGAGYIGSHVVLEISKRSNDNVVVLDDLSTGNKKAIKPYINFYKGSMLDYKLVKNILINHNIDTIIHLSAKLIVPESVKDPIKYFENNVYGLIQILKAMNESNVKNLVFSSTAAVYGDHNDKKIINENSIKDPINPYGQSKRSCEWLIKAACKAYGINYVIFRYFNVAGADQSFEIGQSTKNTKEITHLIPSIMEVALGIKPELKIYGNNYPTKDGSCIRDYIHVSDLAIVHILGAKYISKGKSNTFNLGSNIGYSVLEILEIAKEVTKRKIKSVIYPFRPGDPAILIASNKKAKIILKWEPKMDIKEIIRTDFLWRQNKKF